jgi:hypothetical protein
VEAGIAVGEDLAIGGKQPASSTCRGLERHYRERSTPISGVVQIAGDKGLSIRHSLRRTAEVLISDSTNWPP